MSQPFDYDLVDPSATDAMQEHPKVQWINGDPHKKGLAKTGGFFFSAKYFPPGTKIPGWHPVQHLFKNKTALEAGLSSTEAVLAVIRSRFQFLAKAGRQEFTYPRVHYNAAVARHGKVRGRLQLLAARLPAFARLGPPRSGSLLTSMPQ